MSMPEVCRGGNIGTVFAHSQFALDKTMPSAAEVAALPSGIDNPGELRTSSAGVADHAHDIISPYEYLPLFSKRGRNGQYDGGDGKG